MSLSHLHPSCCELQELGDLTRGFARPRSWSFVHSSQTVSVVPFRHDEYPRFIVGAYPFYSGAASTIVAFLVFSALWVGWSGDDEKVKGKKAE